MSNLVAVKVYQDVYDKLNAILSDCKTIGDNPIDRIQDFMCDIDNYLIDLTEEKDNGN